MKGRFSILKEIFKKVHDLLNKSRMEKRVNKIYNKPNTIIVGRN